MFVLNTPCVVRDLVVHLKNPGPEIRLFPQLAWIYLYLRGLEAATRHNAQRSSRILWGRSIRTPGEQLSYYQDQILKPVDSAKPTTSDHVTLRCAGSRQTHGGRK
jgi:hypothetical protein